ncbi:hypothetical protein L226DRAFT_541152 [Lentinus tigrinus ALCF2SS1-7]|uniref:uncharacterized protein n=1 Tax=Lentinus tigrinus ALCF2SS1-7 TaxID=1328758 RepID=UPI001165E47B|nr:hypothetical protein L226DRAFT_541173 [Lentinus tigrinus ALCF2SS1-7]RPD67845.1 hypothetical protein L226DRAFT_541152 [Lentinus tigrinus ALCF2SS1-7]
MVAHVDFDLTAAMRATVRAPLKLSVSQLLVVHCYVRHPDCRITAMSPEDIVGDNVSRGHF